MASESGIHEHQGGLDLAFARVERGETVCKENKQVIKDRLNLLKYQMRPNEIAGKKNRKFAKGTDFLVKSRALTS